MCPSLSSGLSLNLALVVDFGSFREGRGAVDLARSSGSYRVTRALSVDLWLQQWFSLHRLVKTSVGAISLRDTHAWSKIEY